MRMKFSDEKRSEYRQRFLGAMFVSFMGGILILSAVMVDYFFEVRTIFSGIQRPSENVTIIVWVITCLVMGLPLCFWIEEFDKACRRLFDKICK